MEFNNAIHSQLDSIFDKYKLNVVQENKNSLHLASPFISITLSHNSYERSNNLFFITSSQNSQTIEIDNEILKNFFKTNLKLSGLNVQNFVSALVIFFERECQSLFQGDTETAIRLEEYSTNRNIKYTRKYKI